jgi:spermidine synthase
MSFPFGLFVVFAGGFVALSYEIVWFRVYSFLSGGSATSFGVLLGAYLAGIAFGSLWSRRFCDTAGTGGDPKRLSMPAALVAVSSLLGFALVPVVAHTVVQANYAWTLPLVALVAGLLGATLPLVAHFGIAPDERAGARLSYLYLANIVGSSLGSLATGFVLLDRLTLADTAVMLGAAGMVLAAVLLWASQVAARVRWLGLIAAATAGMAAVKAPLYAGTYERLQEKQKYEKGMEFGHTDESRHGVITVTKDGGIYGGGMYDGRFNTSFLDNSNLISRAYALAGMHPAPKRVLMVGLSSGSWAQVVAALPGLEKMTVVEISHGYLRLIPRYPQVASVMTNPKIEVVIDDGRRWLGAHPDAKFDLIVQNTTWHWRGMITNLLSAEYFALVKAHLKPGGIFYYNTTESPHALRTGCSVFRHGMRYYNFLAVSDSPVRVDPERLEQHLTQMVIDGRKPADPDSYAARLRIAELQDLFRQAGTADGLIEYCPQIVDRTLDLPYITDDNMVTEFGRPWYVMP